MNEDKKSRRLYLIILLCVLSIGVVAIAVTASLMVSRSNNAGTRTDSVVANNSSQAKDAIRDFDFASATFDLRKALSEPEGKHRVKVDEGADYLITLQGGKAQIFEKCGKESPISKEYVATNRYFPCQNWQGAWQVDFSYSSAPTTLVPSYTENYLETVNSSTHNSRSFTHPDAGKIPGPTFSDLNGDGFLDALVPLGLNFWPLSELGGEGVDYHPSGVFVTAWIWDPQQGAPKQVGAPLLYAREDLGYNRGPSVNIEIQGAQGEEAGETPSKKSVIIRSFYELYNKPGPSLGSVSDTFTYSFNAQGQASLQQVSLDPDEPERDSIWSK